MNTDMFMGADSPEKSKKKCLGCDRTRKGSLLPLELLCPQPHDTGSGLPCEGVPQSNGSGLPCEGVPIIPFRVALSLTLILVKALSPANSSLALSATAPLDIPKSHLKVINGLITHCLRGYALSPLIISEMVTLPCGAFRDKLTRVHS